MTDLGFVIGVDEAGYGPNLGPLVVAATVWQVPAADWGDDGRALLAGIVRDELIDPNQIRPRRKGFADHAIADDAEQPATWLVCDSKRAYQPGKGLAALETSLAIADGLIRPTAGVPVAPLGQRYAPHPSHWPPEHAVTVDPWHAGAAGEFSFYTGPETNRNTVSLRDVRLRDDFRVRLVARGVSLRTMRARIVTAARFNRELDRGIGKADLLLRTGLDLAAELLAELPSGVPAPVRVDCDRIGGRKFYATALAEVFRVPLVTPVAETAVESCYRLSVADRPVEVRYTVQGERRIPVALASMVAKWFRERAMRDFNTYWRQHVSSPVPPGGTPRPFRPTAGYPVDAKRFMTDLGDLPDRLAIGRDRIWRNR